MPFSKLFGTVAAAAAAAATSLEEESFCAAVRNDDDDDADGDDVEEEVLVLDIGQSVLAGPRANFAFSSSLFCTRFRSLPLLFGGC